MIEEYDVEPAKILVVTFTKAAAAEMKERFLNLMGGTYTPVSFGTFHAVFFTILKYAYHFNAGNIVREEQKRQYFREIINDLDLEPEDEKDFIAEIISEISYVKGERLNIEHYYSIHCPEDIFRRIYEAYEKKMRQAGLIDFDDMLLFCHELLVKRPDICKIWQNKFEYILIDEFQDINQIQYDIVKLLAKPQDNLFIVGDDDQSIYRFRGAKPEIMLNFQKDFKQAETILLDINYRCGGTILKAAQRLITNNKKRFQKEIHPFYKQGELVQINSFHDLSEQNEMIVKKILDYHKKGIPFSKMAVLFRTNTQPRALLTKLMEYNIPFHAKDTIPNIYEHWIAKDLDAYMKLAGKNRERSLFLRVMNRPNRYISRNAVQGTMVSLQELKNYYGDKKWMIDRIEKMEYDLERLKSMPPFACIEYIRKAVGYDDYLSEYADYRRISTEELNDVLEELKESARGCEKKEDWFRHQEEYKKELKAKSKEQDYVDSVAMMTMHSAKGLEFDTVFIPDANEGITPHHKALLEDDMEEERRMFYVAATRARNHLHIYFTKERYNKEMQPSRFVGEMMVDRRLLCENSIIFHKTYGKGHIIKQEKGKLIIKFDTTGTEKKLDIDFCIRNQLIKIQENA